MSYPWPGNIRELRNLFERIVLLSQGNRIVTEHLRSAIAPAPSRSDSSTLQTLRSVLESGQIPEDGFDLEGILGQMERDIIQRALDRSGGNQSRTAALLQMKRDKLRYRMKLYGFQDTPAADVG
jgi:two-component system NtrC family response regulator